MKSILITIFILFINLSLIKAQEKLPAKNVLWRLKATTALSIIEGGGYPKLGFGIQADVRAYSFSYNNSFTLKNDFDNSYSIRNGRFFNDFFNFDLDVHYPIASKVKSKKYLLVGLNAKLGWYDPFGINIGLGIDYHLKHNDITMEAKKILFIENAYSIQIGLAHKLKNINSKGRIVKSRNL
jgi:hypothetical protein